MGLFFNRKNHTDIYKGNSIDEKNQEIYRSDSVSVAL